MVELKSLGIDLETFSSVDLSKCGVYRYASSPDFDILLFGYSVDSGEVRVVDLACGEEIPADIVAALSDDSVIKWSYNNNFERVCLSNYFGTWFEPGSWRCTMVWAAYLGLPRSLEDVGAVLGLEKQKLSEGMPRLREREHDNMYAEFSMDTAGKCHLLREDGLCALQLECGPDTLPRVCRIFPRKEVYTAHAREFSLSPACEGVLALLWDLPEGVDFVEEPLHPNDVRYFHPKNEASAHFAPIRSLFIDVLQERSLKLSQRLLLLGLLTQQLQALDVPVLSGDASGPVQVPGQAFVQDLVHKRTLPRPGHAGDAGHDSQGNLYVHAFQVVLFGPQHLQETGGSAALPGDGDRKLAAEVLSRDGFRYLHDLLPFL